MSQCDSDSGKEGSSASNGRSKPMYRQPKLVDNDSNTRLHHLAAKNDVAGVVAYLNEESNAADVANYFGWTPLMMAARHGHFETVKCLLQRGANCTMKNRFGLNVFQISIVSGNLDLVKYLLEHFLTGGISRRLIERHLSVISLAVLYRHPEILKFLIQNHFDIDSATLDTGVTPLMFANATENAEAIATLIEHKADASLKNHIEHTAQDISTIRRQLKLMYTQKPATVSREELQNQHLRQVLQVKAPENSPHQHQMILVSPFPHLKYLAVPQMAIRRSSNVSPIPSTPNVTPIMGNAFQPQFFFPADFSPNHRSPVPMTTLAYNSLIAQSYGADDLLNARINNTSAGMFLSPPVTNFLYPCM